jgi:hypothetical protein
LAPFPFNQSKPSLAQSLLKPTLPPSEASIVHVAVFFVRRYIQNSTSPPGDGTDDHLLPYINSLTMSSATLAPHFLAYRRRQTTSLPPFSSVSLALVSK